MQELGEARREAPALAIVTRHGSPCEIAALTRKKQKALANRGCGGQQRLLLHERDAQAVAALKLAVIHLQQAGDDFEQRGFAGAVAADEAHALADLHRETGSIEERAVAVGKMGIENRDEGHTFPIFFRSALSRLDSRSQSLYSAPRRMRGARSAPR